MTGMRIVRVLAAILLMMVCLGMVSWADPELSELKKKKPDSVLQITMCPNSKEWRLINDDFWNKKEYGIMADGEAEAWIGFDDFYGPYTSFLSGPNPGPGTKTASVYLHKKQYKSGSNEYGFGWITTHRVVVRYDITILPETDPECKKKKAQEEVEIPPKPIEDPGKATPHKQMDEPGKPPKPEGEPGKKAGPPKDGPGTKENPGGLEGIHRKDITLCQFDSGAINLAGDQITSKNYVPDKKLNVPFHSSDQIRITNHDPGVVAMNAWKKQKPNGTMADFVFTYTAVKPGYAIITIGRYHEGADELQQPPDFLTLFIKVHKLSDPECACPPKKNTFIAGENYELDEKLTKEANKPKDTSPPADPAETVPKPVAPPKPDGSLKNMKQTGLRSGLWNDEKGQYALYLPQDMRPGDNITGTLAIQPNGSTPAEQQANLAQLQDYSLKVEGTQIPMKPGPVSFSIPADPVHMETVAVIQDEDNKAVGETGFQLSRPQENCDPPQTMEFIFPAKVAIDEFIRIGGQFDGEHHTSACKVGDKPAKVIAESPRGVVVENPATTTGPVQVTITENGRTQTGTIEIVPSETPPPASEESSVERMKRELCDGIVSLYRQNLESMIDQGWQAPKPPRKGTWTARLEYELDRAGHVQNVRVIESSGYAPIDQSAAQRVYQMQGQFRPLPSCYPDPTMSVTHWFKVIYR